MPGAPIYSILPVGSEPPQNVQVLCPAAGTAVPLAAIPTACIEVLIQAMPSNTGDIWVGGPTIANDGSQGGAVLKKQGATSQPVALTLSARDLHLVYINSTVNGEGVNILFW